MVGSGQIGKGNTGTTEDRSGRIREDNLTGARNRMKQLRTANAMTHVLSKNVAPELETQRRKNVVAEVDKARQKAESFLITTDDTMKVSSTFSLATNRFDYSTKLWLAPFREAASLCFFACRYRAIKLTD